MDIRTLKSFLRYPISYIKFRKKGKKIWLGRSGIFAHAEQIELGNNIFINTGFYISAYKLVFGDNILIGPNLLIECDDHIYNRVGESIFDVRKDKVKGFVTLENDIWLGANVTILKNVEIKEGCIVGAGSVVTKSTLPYTINVGNPSKPIRMRFSLDDLEKHLSIINSKYNFSELLNIYKSAALI